MEVTILVHVCINVAEQRCGQISPRIEMVFWGSAGLNESWFCELWRIATWEVCYVSMYIISTYKYVSLYNLYVGMQWYAYIVYVWHIM